MRRPDLRMLAQWLDPVLIAMLENRRRMNNEWRRRRKLATLETLWLMLAVSLDTHRYGLYEILRLATADLGIKWSISVPAFCKASCAFFPWTLCPGCMEHWYRGCKEPAKKGTPVGTDCGCLPPTRQPWHCPTLVLFGNASALTRGLRDWGRLQLSFAACLMWSAVHPCALSMARYVPRNISSS